MEERSPVSMFVNPCSSVHVEKVILSMANKRCNLDNILVKIYKFLVEKLSGDFACVFNLSFEQGIVRIGSNVQTSPQFINLAHHFQLKTTDQYPFYLFYPKYMRN